MKARRLCSVIFESVGQKRFKEVSRFSPKIVPISAVLMFVSAHNLFAQDTNEINQLKQQLREMRESFERVQNEQRQQIDALTKKLDELTKEKATDAEKKKLAEQLAAELGTTNQPATTAAPSAAPAGQPAASWSASEPITIA